MKDLFIAPCKVIWISESGKIQNPGLWNPGIQLKESRIPLTIDGMRNPNSTHKESGIQFQIRASKIQDPGSQIALYGAIFNTALTRRLVAATGCGDKPVTFATDCTIKPV